MLFKKGELKHLKYFYLASFVEGLTAMIMPFIFIFFLDKGLSFSQIGAMMFALTMTVFIFEVPTGAFADGVSRKYSTIIGLFIMGFSVILIPFQSQFIILLGLWTLYGFGQTFVSGAYSAWVIDNLNEQKIKDLHQEYFIKESSIMSFGVVIAPIIGALIVKFFSMDILWYVLGAGQFVMIIILLFFVKEYYKPKKVHISKFLRKTLNNSKEGFKFTHKHKNYFFFLIGTIFVVLMMIGEIGWQPFLVDLSMPKYFLGFLVSIMGLFGMIIPFFSRLFTNMKVKYLMSIIIFIRIIFLLSLLLIYPPFFFVGMVVFILYNGIRGLPDPLVGKFIHKLIPSKIRATVISVQSMILSLVYGVMVLFAGILMDFFGPQKILALCGLFGIGAIYFFMKIKD